MMLCVITMSYVYDADVYIWMCTTARWPAPVQYMKGEFGGGAPEVDVEVILAEPIDACGGLTNADAAQGKVSCSVYMHKQCLHA
jgi:hypothetical protein